MAATIALRNGIQGDVKAGEMLRHFVKLSQLPLYSRTLVQIRARLG